MDTNQKELVALCCPGREFPWQWVNSFAQFLPRLLEQHSVCIEMASSNNIYHLRNRCVSDILNATKDTALDWVLWVDSDNIINFDQFLLLKQALTDHPELAGIGAAYYVQSGVPGGVEIAAGWFKQDEHLKLAQIEQSADPIQVDYLGFGFLLMRGSVLQTMGDHPFDPVFFDGHLQPDDSSFMFRAKSNGFQFAVHPKVFVPHLKVLELQPNV